MFKNFSEIYKLIIFPNFKKLFILQFLILFAAILEFLGIFSVLPYIYLLTNQEKILSIGFLSYLYRIFGFSEINLFLISISLFLFIFYLISNLFSFYVYKKSVEFSQKFMVELSNQIFDYYLNKKWLFYIHSSNNNLAKNLLIEVGRVTQGIVQPILNINVKISISLLIIISLFFFNPFITLIVTLSYLTVYFSIFQYFKAKLINYGYTISKVSASRYQLIYESFASIKEIVFNNIQQIFSKKFNESGSKLIQISINKEIIAAFPKYIIEVVTFGLILIILSYLFFIDNKDDYLILVSVFALAAYKLIPSLQQLYSNFAHLNSNIPAFVNLKKDLFDINIIKTISQKKINSKSIKIKKILLSDVFFKYESIKNKRRTEVFKNLNLIINAGKIISIYGKTGSGKSTFIDLITGLMDPDQGSICLLDNNNQKINTQTSFFSFTSQNPFFLNGTILENICFGQKFNKNNFQKLKEIAKTACLDDFIDINKLDSFDLILEDNSKNLSGGQKQRIAIARSLYFDKQILIFDESTNSLDDQTTKKIMNNLKAYKNKYSKTIIFVTHNKFIAEFSDIVLSINNKKINAQ